jgi:hypothetical protein
LKTSAEDEGMHLIHVRLSAPVGAPERTDMAAIISSYAEEGDGLEHISVHPEPPQGVTLGFFLLAASLAGAEDSAVRLTRRALEGHPGLRGYRVAAAGTALVPGPWWEE